ncbi:unnamed protein product [Schistocephalus solidus]|uniref:EKC/KEOPS complex subunit CGI121 n=1 Tax=Schistocephalus solidus TaxID=70667 RepID=A0A183T4R5_SCHSO|nr:unnamed protein product [Schistocephalus solidus]
MERLLSIQIPWNVGVVAESAKRLEQLDLDCLSLTIFWSEIPNHQANKLLAPTITSFSSELLPGTRLSARSTYLPVRRHCRRYPRYAPQQGDAARVQAEEEARQRAIERARVNKLTTEKAEEATARMRVEAVGIVLGEITDLGVDLAFKKWIQLEKARIKAEKAAKRRAAEEAGEEVPEEGAEDED